MALKNLVTRNADFAVAGMPAAMSLRANGGDDPFLATLLGPLTAAMESFRPEFVLVSAGFDAHRHHVDLVLEPGIASGIGRRGRHRFDARGGYRAAGRPSAG